MKQRPGFSNIPGSMSKSETYHEYDGEALNSPFSRLYLCRETEQIMNCAMGLKYPIDVEALKKAFSNSLILEHPRFCSLMLRNPNSGDHYWKKIHVNIDDHFIIHHYPTTKTNTADLDNEAAVNAYLADIAVSTPLSKKKPLWEVHVLVGLKCVVLRVHHALGDGVSLMSMLSSCFGQKRGILISGVNGDHRVKEQDTHVKRKWKVGVILGLIRSMWLTLVFGLRLLGRVLWVKDKASVVSGGDGVELWSRKLVTAKFKIEDFKSIKMAVPNVTINDVLLGMISSGLTKYVQINSPKAIMQQMLPVTAILVVNLRKKPCIQEETCKYSKRASSNCGGFSSWGNKTGLVLLPINCCNGLHQLDHVRAMKATMDKKKHSYEAHISYNALKLLTSYLGPKVTSWCCHRVLCNTTLLISNIMGPSEEIAIGDNPIMNIRVNISGQPHAITIHMVSYAGKADLQVMVAKDIIPDPEILVKFFQDSLDEMKNSIKMNAV